MSGCAGITLVASNSITKPQEISCVRRQRKRPRASVNCGELVSQRSAIHQAPHPCFYFTLTLTTRILILYIVDLATGLSISYAQR
jgi:hypothetical protein